MKRVRWWLLGLLGVGAAGSLAWIWSLATVFGAAEKSGQEKVMATGLVGVLTLALLFVWLLLLSGWSLRTRLSIVVAGAVLAAAAGGFLEIRGVTGDLVPIVGLKSSRPELTVDVPPPAAEAGETAAPPAAPRSAFPQFRGVRRDGHVDGVTLARDWAARPPRLVWEREVGAGWSGFAVAGNDAITQEQRGDRECVVCYDRDTGTPRWLHADDARYDDVVGGVGPRATPTIDGDRVFTLGSTGLLNALDRATGAPVWRRDVLADHDAVRNEWGMSGSPLVHGDVVIVFAGGDGAIAAYDRETGTPRWSGGSDRAGYSSPLLATLAGVEQVVALQGKSVAGYDARDGRELWSTPWSRLQPNVAQPLPLPGDRLLVSSGYGVGSALFRIGREDDGSLAAEEVWRSRALKAKFANFVERDGFVYGIDDGIMVCVEAETGRRAWKGGRFGHGQLLLVGDLLLLTEEQGDVLLVEASPDALREVTRFSAFDEKQWNPPAFAAPHLFVRTADRAACYELPLE